MIFRTDLADILLDTLAVLVADMQTGEILFATRTAEQLFGYALRNSLLGVNVDALVPDDRRQGHAAHRAAYAAHPWVRPMGAGMVLAGRKKDGSTFPVQVVLVPAVMDGQTCVVAIVVDLPALPAAGAGVAHGG